NAPGCFPLLLPWLRDEDAGLRRNAADALEHLGWLPSTSAERVLNAIAFVNFQGINPEEEAAVEILLPFLKNNLASVRAATADTIEQILLRRQDERVVEPLIRALKDSETSVCSAALHALARSTDERRIPSLLAILKNSSIHLRAPALKAVGRVADPKLFSQVAPFLRDANYEVRLAAISALGRLKNPEALPLLLPFLKEEDADVRRSTVESLARLRDPRSIRPLIEMLVDVESVVRHAAANALQVVNCDWRISEEAKKIVPLFEEGLKHADYRVRDAAAKAIHRVRNM
ncbi:MAG: HEAT repeat domain-containing protein, partial [Verrucomicrobiota bacterium]